MFTRKDLEIKERINGNTLFKLNTDVKFDGGIFKAGTLVESLHADMAANEKDTIVTFFTHDRENNYQVNGRVHIDDVTAFDCMFTPVPELDAIHKECITKTDKLDNAEKIYDIGMMCLFLILFVGVCALVLIVIKSAFLTLKISMICFLAILSLSIVILGLKKNNIEKLYCKTLEEEEIAFQQFMKENHIIK